MKLTNLQNFPYNVVRTSSSFHPFNVHAETHVWKSKVLKSLILPDIVNSVS